MSRDITAGMQTEVAAAALSPILLAEMDFSGGFVRVWSGLGDLSWNGYTWTGVGDLAGVSQIAESTDFKANGVQLQLSGIPSAMISVALGEKYQGRPCNIYFGAMDDSGAVVADPFLLFGGSMDTMTISESGETSTIAVSVESRAIDLKRSRERRYTHEDQQIDYPGDLGFEYVAGLQDKDVIWKPA